MTICSLAEYRERQRVAAEVAYVEIERQVIAARDEIMTQALRRIAAVDPHVSFEPVVGRLGRIWRDAWPFDVVGP